MYQKINEPAKTVTEYEQGKAIPSQAVLAKMERVLGIKLVCYLSSISLALILEWIALSVYSHPTCLYTHTLSLSFIFFFSLSLFYLLVYSCYVTAWKGYWFTIVNPVNLYTM